MPHAGAVHADTKKSGTNALRKDKSLIVGFRIAYARRDELPHDMAVAEIVFPPLFTRNLFPCIPVIGHIEIEIILPPALCIPAISQRYRLYADRRIPQIKLHIRRAGAGPGCSDIPVDKIPEL